MTRLRRLGDASIRTAERILITNTGRSDGHLQGACMAIANR